MKNTGRICCWLLAAALTAGGITVQAQEEASLVELFYTYTGDNVIVSYTDSDYLLGSTQIQSKLYDGFLALSETDLDWDGVNELLAIRLKPAEDENGVPENTVVAEIYRRQENALKRTAQYTLAQQVLDAEAGRVDVFAVQAQSGQIICCEASDRSEFLADGIQWSLRAISFEQEAFGEEVNVSLLGSSFSAEDMAPVYEGLNRLGLNAGEPVWQPLAGQTEHMGLICSAERTITDREGAIAHMNSGSAENYLYGETHFVNAMNPERENKFTKDFVTENEQAAPAVTQQAAGSAGATTYSFAGDYVIPDSDSRYITQEDLQALSANEIFLARNEIYAKHGRIFNNTALDAYFRSKTWYQPSVPGAEFTEEYAAGVFNDYEVQNIDTMIAYEKAHGLNDFS